MGKITDALKKVMQEREKQAQLKAGQEAEQIIPLVSQTGQEEYQPAQAKSIFSLFKPNRQAKGNIDPRIVTYHDYDSPISEQYRTLRSNIKYQFKKQAKIKKTNPQAVKSGPRIISITSSLHCEGKSITSVNLAVALARESGQKVLLIDADLRGGSVADLLGIDEKPGLADILTSDYDYSVALHPTLVDNLYVIPSGSYIKTPSDILSSKKMEAIIAQLRCEPIDYVIIDTPPVMLFSDAAIVSSLTDAVMLVVQAYRTQEKIVRKAKDILLQAHARFLGFILTQSDSYSNEPYGGYYSAAYRYYRSKSKDEKEPLSV